jgi:hypothetical protein
MVPSSRFCYLSDGNVDKVPNLVSLVERTLRYDASVAELSVGHGHGLWCCLVLSLQFGPFFSIVC